MAKHFRPHYSPKAGLRKARLDAQYANHDAQVKAEHAERNQRQREDQQRQRMMAKLEPERYLRMVDEGAFQPTYRDVALKAILAREEHGR